MHNVTDDIVYIGVKDCDIDFFEGMYRVPEGITYNSFVIRDEKTAVTDSVDGHFGKEWLKNIKIALNGGSPDYLIIHHMEPDHSANIAEFLKEYPSACIVGNAKTFTMIKEYFGFELTNCLTVQEGSTLQLGKHTLHFILAPFVHWPEVMVSYDSCDKVIFSADAFGKFGTWDSENWTDEARKYYIGIVGKYGAQVQSLLKKLSALDIQKVLPLHGPVLEYDLAKYINLYDIWSSYKPEKHAVMVAYASVYGHTRQAALAVAEKLKKAGEEVVVCDLIRADRAECVAQAFACDRLVLASVTYNAVLFPAMREFIDCLTERGYKNRTIGFIENGTWAPVSAKLMRERLAPCKDISFIENTVKVRAALSEENTAEIEKLVSELHNAI